MSSFLKSASRQVTDVRAFLRDNSSGSSIKYSPEKGAKHFIYIPYTSSVIVDEASGTQVPTKNIVAIQGNVHEWNTPDGKFKATLCLKNVVRNDENTGVLINDGCCPFCDRIGDSWDIYNYRKQHEELTCKLVGEQRTKHLEKANKTFVDERKTKEVRNYMYILVVKFKVGDAGTPVIGADGLPEYELKVMKLSSTRVEKIQNQISNSGEELPGAELVFQYPNEDDKRLLVSQSTFSNVFEKAKITTKYPDLLNKINTDIAKFEWEGIDKAFPEWQGMSSVEAKTVVEDMFTEWDKYNLDKKTNPSAKYLEYVVETPSSMPSLGSDMPLIPSVPNVGNAVGNGVVAPNINNVGNMGITPPPVVPMPNINDVFSNNGNGGIQI